MGGAFHLNQEQVAVTFRTIAQIAVLNGGFFYDLFRNIIGTASRLVDGLPYQRGIGHVEHRGEWLSLHTQFCPQVAVSRQQGDIGTHIHLQEHTRHAGTVFIQQVPIGEPCVVLIVITAILHPSRKRHILRHIVETMPYRVGDTGKGRHVGAYLQKLERGVEHQVGVGHLLATHKTLACLMGGRRHIFVYHRIPPSLAVVRVGHLFAQPMAEPVCGPRFSFGNIAVEGRLLDEESTAIRLLARFHTLLLAPGGVDMGIALHEQFRFRKFKVITHTVHLVLEGVSFLRAEIVVGNLAQTSHLKHGEGQPRHDVIAPAFAELFPEVGSPVGTFQLHTVYKEGTQVLAKRSCLGLYGVGRAF